MKKYLGFIKTSILIASLLFVYSFCHIKWINKNVKNVEVKVEHFNDNIFVNKKMVLEDLISDRNIKLNGTREDISVFSIEKRLNNISFVKNAEAYVDHYGVLQLNIEEKIPVARVKTFNSEFYLTNLGAKMELSDVHSAKTILIQGNIQDNELVGILELLETVNENKLLKNKLIGVVKGGDKLFNLFFSHIESVVVLGEIKDVSKKLEKLLVFQKYHLKYMTPDCYEKIDLRFDSQVVGKIRKKL